MWRSYQDQDGTGRFVLDRLGLALSPAYLVTVHVEVSKLVYFWI